ncbi:MAG TPA: DNA methylase, partial [bacterium]|nr:DNA methylase [bacterium]HPH52996.1 DNA methylase [Bacteroidales bacterium]
LLVRRLNITAGRVIEESTVPQKNVGFEQLDLFTDYEALQADQEREKAELEREKKMQQAMLTIKKRYGKNAILKGMNLEEGATAKDRNAQIGGHKA